MLRRPVAGRVANRRATVASDSGRDRLYRREVSGRGRVRYVDSGLDSFDMDLLPTKGATLISRDGKGSTWYTYRVEPARAEVVSALRETKEAIVSAIVACGTGALRIMPDASDEAMMAAWGAYRAELERRSVDVRPLVLRGTSPYELADAAIAALEKHMDEDRA